MTLYPGWEPFVAPGRCTKCGFHVPTQLHRRYCPNTGLDATESQHPLFNSPIATESTPAPPMPVR